jgi:hypothetical protein
VRLLINLSGNRAKGDGRPSLGSARLTANRKLVTKLAPTSNQWLRFLPTISNDDSVIASTLSDTP